MQASVALAPCYPILLPCYPAQVRSMQAAVALAARHARYRGGLGEADVPDAIDVLVRHLLASRRQFDRYGGEVTSNRASRVAAPPEAEEVDAVAHDETREEERHLVTWRLRGGREAHVVAVAAPSGPPHRAPPQQPRPEAGCSAQRGFTVDCAALFGRVS